MTTLNSYVEKLSFHGGGAYRKKLIRARHFQSIYNADTGTVYHSSFPFEVYDDARHRDKGYYHMPLEKEDYWVFRVREVRDTKGNLLSANYGKIYGPIEIFDHFYFYKSYFNTTPNDTNLEEKMSWLQPYYTTPNENNSEQK